MGSRSNKIDWTRIDPLLATVDTKDLVIRFGVSRETIAARRKSLGIKAPARGGL